MTGEFNPKTIFYPDFPVFDFKNIRMISVGTLCNTEYGKAIITERDYDEEGNVWAELCFSYDKDNPQRCSLCNLSPTCKVFQHTNKLG